MRKLLLSIFFGAVIVLLMGPGEYLWSRLPWLEAPQVHQIQKGESLSKLAKQHYGEADYWRELALVNRPPNPNHIEPGEEALLPAANVMQELRAARTLTRVNVLVADQQAAASHNLTSREEQRAVETVPPAAEATSPATQGTPAMIEEKTASNETPQPVAVAMPETPQEEGALSSIWFWLVLGLIAAAGVAGYFFYRRRQQEQERDKDGISKKFESEPPSFQRDRRSFTPTKTESLTA
jgi:hypothetical protein